MNKLIEALEKIENLISKKYTTHSFVDILVEIKSIVRESLNGIKNKTHFENSGKNWEEPIEVLAVRLLGEIEQHTTLCVDDYERNIFLQGVNAGYNAASGEHAANKGEEKEKTLTEHWGIKTAANKDKVYTQEQYSQQVAFANREFERGWEAHAEFIKVK